MTEATNTLSHANLQDAELIELAVRAGELTSRGRRQLIAELEKRLLVPQLLPALRAHIEIASAKDIADLVARIQQTPCPVCDNRWTQLNGFFIERKTLDVVAYFEVERYFFIACQPCMTLEGNPTSPRLGPDSEWKPSEDFVEFVQSHAPALLFFEDRPDLVHALLGMDFQAFLCRIEAPDHELIHHIETSVVPDPSTLQEPLRESHSEVEVRDWSDTLAGVGIRSVVTEHQVPGSRDVVYRLELPGEQRALAAQILDGADEPTDQGFCFFCGASTQPDAAHCPECDADLADEE